MSLRTLLLTGYDQTMQPLGDLTAPRMLEYASIHEFDFQCLRQFPGTVSYWHKLYGVKWAFQSGYDRVFWLDADQLITNFTYTPPWEYGFHASLDWGIDAMDKSHFSMCGFVACKDTKHIFDWVLQREAEYINGEFPDQKPMRDFYTIHHGSMGTIMETHCRKVFNSVPKQIHESVVEPWETNDFAAHITMLPVHERVRIFYEIMEEANIPLEEVEIEL